MLAQAKGEEHQSWSSGCISSTFSSGPHGPLRTKPRLQPNTFQQHSTCLSLQKIMSCTIPVKSLDNLKVQPCSLCCRLPVYLCTIAYIVVSRNKQCCQCTLSVSVLACAWTHSHTCHQAAGRRQRCSLKGKVNSCACDSWSSHDIPSPNIRDGSGRTGVSAERGPFTTWMRRRGFSPQPDCSQFFSSSHLQR